MAYTKVYTYGFDDIHILHPARWRVDIYDDQGSPGFIPIVLVPAADPLSIETVETSDNKNVNIIGTQATLQYEYTGASNEPSPELFFDTDERRFQVQIFKDEVLYGTYYVKPDSAEYDDKIPPYTVTLTAVDGLGFIKGIDWNAYDNGGLLAYRRLTLYDIIVSRGLYLSLDPTTEVNVINTLKPANITGTGTTLNDLYVHSDMFIDFTKGPEKVHPSISKPLQSLYARLFTSENKIWIQRIPDLYPSGITAEHYQPGGIYSALPLPTITRTIGAQIAGNDAIPAEFNAKNISFSAVKQVEFNTDYRGINRLLNFLWNNFDGTDFSNWRRQAPLTVTRIGTGTFLDPYAAFLNYSGGSSPDAQVTLSQGSTGTNDIFENVGSIVQCAFRYKFVNTSNLNIAIHGLDVINGDQISLDNSGQWVNTTGLFPAVFQISRTGNKQDGSFSVNSVPIPAAIGDHVLTGPFRMFFSIYEPGGVNSLDGAAAPGVAIYPPKFASFGISSAGRVIKDVNNGRFSKVEEQKKFYFIDTGDANISNTIFINNVNTPAANWHSATGDTHDIEQHMADAQVDQYAQSVRGWDGRLYSNTIEMWNRFIFDYKPGKVFIMINDKYSVRNCTHDCNLQQILPENSAETTYSEIDLEDSNN